MVKRVGNLMTRIADPENLREAFLRASQGKSGKKSVMEFRCHLEENLSEMRRQLLDGSLKFGHYHFFTIYDPKQRTICAASFQERVVFHAMMRICHPVFDGYQIDGSCASRIGKGTYKALEKAQEYAAIYRFFAKLDVCKYFDSIDHEVMLSQLCRLFKDRQLLLYFRNLLDSYEVDCGCGLPIGNLTSQYFANHYLAVADHYAKEKIKVPALIRYMDDVLFFSNDQQNLMRMADSYRHYLKSELRLSTHPIVANRTCFGIPFLGYVVYGSMLRLNQRSRRRFARKIEELDKNFWMWQGSEQECASRSLCLFAFVNKAEVKSYLHGLYEKGQYS